VEKRKVLARVFAIVGTVVLWLVVAAPFVLALVALASHRGFRFDFLIPGELAPVVLGCGVLLVVAAILARSHVRPIVVILAASVVLLVVSQGLAMLTGLASGRIEAEGPPFIAVLTIFVGYDLGVVALAIVGTLLARRLFRAAPAP
jgi:hypothetical protein